MRRPRGTVDTTDTVRVLFVQSHLDFTPAAAIHYLLMRESDPARVEVHLAAEAHARTSPTTARELRNVTVRPTRFLPTMYLRSRRAVVESLLRDAPRAVASLAALIAYTRRHRIDVVHFDERPRNALYGLTIGRAAGARTVCHLHSTPLPQSMSANSLRFLRQADAVVCVSAFVERVALQQGQPHERTHVVLSAIDVSRWDPETDGTAVRAEFGIARDELVLTIIARVVPWKGHPELLEALGRLSGRIPPFRLLIVGEEDETSGLAAGNASAALREQAARLGIADRIIFTGRRSDVAQVLAASDIYAMPSHTESFGLVFAEAMAMRVPVVAFDVGGVGEVVEHGRTGLLSPHGDVDQLAANIALLANDPAIRRVMGEAGRLRVESEFAPARMAAQTEEVYRSLLSRGRRRRR